MTGKLNLSDILCDMKWESENIPGMWLYDCCPDCDGKKQDCEYRQKNHSYSEMDLREGFRIKFS